MKLRTSLVIFIGIFLLQPFIDLLLPVSADTNIAFCVLMALALNLENSQLVKPIVTALVLALFGDICLSQFIGPTVIAMTVPLAAVLLVKREANIENPLISVAIALSTEFLYRCTYWLIYRALGSPYTFMYMIRRAPVGAAVDCVIMLSLIAVFVNRNIQARRERYFR